jgi:hypothetical protein
VKTCGANVIEQKLTLVIFLIEKLETMPKPNENGFQAPGPPGNVISEDNEENLTSSQLEHVVTTVDNWAKFKMRESLPSRNSRGPDNQSGL